MNKFKKILLGTLSVLTLGLFVATGAKVNAADEYYYWKNSSDAVLLNSEGNASIPISGHDSIGNSDRGFGSVDSIIPNGANVSATNKDKFIKVKNTNTLTFTIESSFYLTFTGYNNGTKSTDKVSLLKGSETKYTYTNSLASKVYQTYDYSEELESGTYSIISPTELNVYEVYILLSSTTSKALESFDSISFVSNKAYCVGNTVSKDDLVVMATYTGEASAEITKYTFKVYDANDEEVTGAFTTSGDGYYVVATSTEDTTKSVTSSTFSVGEQTKFVYDFDAIASTTPFSADTNNHDYTTPDNVIELATFKKISSATLSFDDGTSFTNKAGLQGSTMTINLAKAAKITVYARQSGNTVGKHDIRYMYFEDENNNAIDSNMNFSLSNVSSSVKAFSINLSAGTYSSHSTDGSFNIYAIVIDYTDSASLDTTHTTLILEHSTGTALSGTGTAARFVGKLDNVNIDDVTSITLDLTLTLSDSTKKNASITITSLYNGLPGYDAAEGTLYFYYVIKGLEREAYAGCSIKGTATVVMGSAKGFSSTTWTNA